MPDELIRVTQKMHYIVTLDATVTNEIPEEFLRFKNSVDPVEATIEQALIGLIQSKTASLRTMIEQVIPVGLLVDFENVSVVPLETRFI